MGQTMMGKVERKQQKIRTAPHTRVSCPPPGPSSSPSSCLSSQRGRQTLRTEPRAATVLHQGTLFLHRGGRVSLLLRETVSVAVKC